MEIINLIKDLTRKYKECQFCKEVREFSNFRKRLSKKCTWVHIFRGLRNNIFICDICESKFIPHDQKVYPNYIEKPTKNIGIQEIEVKNIIGGNSNLSYEYWNDWTMKYKDRRMMNLERSVMTQNFVDSKKLEDMLCTFPIIEPIHLLSFIEKDKPKVYYVSGDGHRRISLAKRFKINKVIADVTEVYYS
ncbi:MAG: hypothetical protein ACFFHV_20730 [Promethearchaeota archaeon]